MRGIAENTEYHTVRGSDVGRDAFYIELFRTEGNGEVVSVAEAVWWDATNRFTLEEVNEPLPAAVAEAFLKEARAMIKPTNIGQETNTYRQISKGEL